MALGGSTFTRSSGGGATGPGAQTGSRQLILAGVSPGGTVNTLYKPSSDTAAKTTTGGVGPLAEAALLAFNAKNNRPLPMLLVLEPSAAGDVSATTHVGTGTATLTASCASHIPFIAKVSTAGTIETMKIRLSYDGGTTYGDEILSEDSSGGDWIYRIPGTFVVATFAAGTYVLNSTYTFGVTSLTPTRAGSAINTVTATASPVDTFEIRAKVRAGGALGTATLEVSLDNGTATGGGGTTLPLVPLPAGGVVAIPNTGVVLTGSGTFVADDVYSIVAAPPGYSTSDLTAAITALCADPTAPTSGVIVLVDNASTHTSGFAAAVVFQTALTAAESSYGLDYEGMINVPCSEGNLGGDVVYDSGAKRSSTTSTNIRTAALSASAMDRVSIFAGAHRVACPIQSALLQRTAALIVALRVTETTPAVGVAYRGGEGLRVDGIGRDELTASVSLHDVRVNVLQTVRGDLDKVWLSVEKDGLGWRNFTTDPNFQDADAMRMVNAAIATLRPITARIVGDRPRTNSDGTIHEDAAKEYDLRLDSAWKRAIGLLAGGPFNTPQASNSVNGQLVTVDRSSQLGQSPYELVVNYNYQRLGFVSNVVGNVRISGVQ